MNPTISLPVVWDHITNKEELKYNTVKMNGKTMLINKEAYRITFSVIISVKK